MNKLLIAINNSGMTKQNFAERVQIPYYRVATILYGQGSLSDSEEKRVEEVFGSNIFFTDNYTKCLEDNTSNKTRKETKL